MGRSKLTLDLGGRTFLERAMLAAADGPGIGRCLVVVRPEDARLVEEALPLLPSTGPASKVETVLNPHAADGQSASVRLAAARLLEDATCEAAIFVVVDQPFLDRHVFEILVEAWTSGRGEILISTYDGQRGNPVLFARRFFGELVQLTGDVGGRGVVLGHPDAVGEVAMPDPRAGRDVDTWEDYIAAGGTPT